MIDAPEDPSRSPTELAAPPAVNPEHPPGHLTKHLVSAIAWTAAVKWGTQMLSWASMVIVVHLLSPEDFGLFGIATAYTGLITLLSEFGIGTAIITLRDLDDEQVSQLNALAVLIGLGLASLSILIAQPLSLFFRSPQVKSIIVCYSLVCLVSGFRSVPLALLQMKFQYKTISGCELVQMLVQTSTTLLLAWLGAGYWALVVAGIAATVASTVMINISRPTSLRRPRLAVLRDPILFSWRILVSRLSWYLYSNADFVIAGRFLGTAPLGIYTVAWNMANLPGEKVTSLILRVTPTFFAAVQHSTAELRKLFSRLTEGISLILFPVVIGFGLVASDLVPLAFGDKWTGAIRPMQLLFGYCFIRSVAALWPQVINVVGQTRFGMWNSLAMLAVLPGCFVVGSRWGVVGIAGVWVAVYPLVMLPLLVRTLRSLEMPLKSYLDSLFPSIVCSLIMGAVVAGAHAGLLGVSAWTRMSVEVALGVITYGLSLLLLFRRRTQTYQELYRSFRQRR